MSRLRNILILSSLGVAVAAHAAAWDKKGVREAAARATEAFDGHGFVTKIPLVQTSQFYVLPDGSPSDKAGKKQGRHGMGRGSFSFVRGGTVAEGDRGAQIRVWGKQREIQFALYKKQGAKLNPALVHILFDRETTVDDFDPHALARAVSSLVVIDGYEPGSGVAAALDAAIEEAAEAVAAAPSAIPQAAPTLLQVTVRAEPDQVRAGASVRLILEYELSPGAASVEVTETRTLSLDGQVMPTYPVVDALSRAPGPYTSSYEQPLPAAVAPGTYTFDGQVCAGGDCISRTAAFTVLGP